MQEAIQANLVIRLLANDVVVAESTAPRLWQAVLSSILTGSQDDLPEKQRIYRSGGDPKDADASQVDGRSPENATTLLAEKLDVSKEVLVGALAPAIDAPFIHLDTRTWEAYKNNFPSRGSNAVAAVVVAATALVVWFIELGMPGPTAAQAQAVLNTIHVTGKNPTRSINNCEWLQLRNGRIVLNPARASQAYSVLKAFCLREGPPRTDQ